MQIDFERAYSYCYYSYWVETLLAFSPHLAIVVAVVGAETWIFDWIRKKRVNRFEAFLFDCIHERT